MTHHHKTFFTALKRRHLEESSRLQKRDREIRREAWKRDLSERVNGTIDPWVSRLLTFVLSTEDA
jgi:carboxypeptidase D